MPFMPPTNTKYVVDGRVMGGTMFRKVAKRTKLCLLPAEAAEENSALQPLQQLEEDEGEEDVPPAKRSRLHAPSSVSNAAAAAGFVQEHARIETRVTTTDETPTDDIPTDPVTPAASLVSKVTSRTYPRHWNVEEDTKLIEAVKKHGKKWLAVAAMVPGRTDKQCRNRWTQVIDPVAAAAKTKGIWKLEEDTKLTEAVKKYGQKWVAVAAMVAGRTDDQCRKRWTQTLDTAGKIVGLWNRDEDTNLSEAVKRHGKNWVAVATLVPGRTDKQCASRWTQTLDPVASRKTAGRWKPEEDAKLIEAVKKHAKKWVAVAALIPGRTDQQCRIRWARNLDSTNEKIAGR
jgi:hypothetical protein